MGLENLVGKEVLGYKVERFTDNGKYCNVYEASNSAIGKKVAIKQLKTDYPKELLRQEGEILCRLQHPNIVQAFNYDAEHGYLVEEFVEGQTLEEYLNKEQPDFKESLSIIQQILEGLDYAHKKGIMHGDLHLKNIKILNNGHVKILDFGHVGTQASVKSTYEDRKKFNITKADDIAAVGRVFYKLLTGEYPYGLEAPSELNKDVPYEIDNVVKKSLSSVNKYSSVGAMLRDLTHGRENVEEERTDSNKIKKYSFGKVAKTSQSVERAYEAVRKNQTLKTWDSYPAWKMTMDSLCETEMKLTPKEVSKLIRTYGKVPFYTFDDLGEILSQTIRNFDREKMTFKELIKSIEQRLVGNTSMLEKSDYEIALYPV